LDSGQKTKIKQNKGFSGQVTENPLFADVYISFDIYFYTYLLYDLFCFHCIPGNPIQAVPASPGTLPGTMVDISFFQAMAQYHPDLRENCWKLPIPTYLFKTPVPCSDHLQWVTPGVVLTSGCAPDCFLIKKSKEKQM
jgi:hypothetical protein